MRWLNGVVTGLKRTLSVSLQAIENQAVGRYFLTSPQAIEHEGSCYRLVLGIGNQLMYFVGTNDQCQSWEITNPADRDKLQPYQKGTLPEEVVDLFLEWCRDIRASQEIARRAYNYSSY